MGKYNLFGAEIIITGAKKVIIMQLKLMSAKQIVFRQYSYMNENKSVFRQLKNILGQYIHILANTVILGENTVVFEAIPFLLNCMFACWWRIDRQTDRLTYRQYHFLAQNWFVPPLVGQSCCSWTNIVYNYFKLPLGLFTAGGAPHF